MVKSNERGRALEYRIAIEIDHFLEKELKLDVISSDSTKRLNFQHSSYFNELDDETKEDFDKCAKAVVKWLKMQDWFDDAATVTIDRFGDDKAKNADPTDIQLGVSYNNGSFAFKNLSVKHHHNALCHPRLPSLAYQCGIKDEKIDLNYRESYDKIWDDFHSKVKSLKRNIATYKELDAISESYKYDWLYEPLQQNAVNFLWKHANDQLHVAAFFKYLVGSNEYYVLKNETGHIEIKHFSGIAQPSGFQITYPYKSRKNTFFMEFNNGWKITFRLHTASSRIEKDEKIYKTEKEDPICINLEKLITIESVAKD